MSEHTELEDMLQEMQEAEDRANDLLLKEQREIGWGDYMIRFHPLDKNRLLVIFTRIFSEYEAFMRNARHILTDSQVTECWELFKSWGVPEAWDDNQWAQMRALIRSFGLGDNHTMEIIHPHEAQRDAYERNYRIGYHLSVALPEGEVGDAHLLHAWPITRQEFQMAQSAGGDPNDPEVATLYETKLYELGVAREAHFGSLEP